MSSQAVLCISPKYPLDSQVAFLIAVKGRGSVRHVGRVTRISAEWAASSPDRPHLRYTVEYRPKKSLALQASLPESLLTPVQEPPQ